MTVPFTRGDARIARGLCSAVLLLLFQSWAVAQSLISSRRLP